MKRILLAVMTLGLCLQAFAGDLSPGENSVLKADAKTKFDYVCDAGKSSVYISSDKNSTFGYGYSVPNWNHIEMFSTRMIPSLDRKSDIISMEDNTQSVKIIYLKAREQRRYILMNYGLKISELDCVKIK